MLILIVHHSNDDLFKNKIIINNELVIIQNETIRRFIR